MAEHLESRDESTTNPCCSQWKDKYLKLQQKVKKLEEGRAFLKKAVDIYKEQFDNLQAQCLKFQKAYEEEKMQTNNERMDKEKESSARVLLENEVSTLKSEILSLRQKGGSVPQHVDEELVRLRGRVSDSEKEINSLREQLQKKRADEVLESSKADKSKVHQELSNLKAQLSNVEKEKKQLKKDLQKEKARADSERKRADEVEVLKADKNKSNNVDQNLETEITRLKELLDKEKKRVDLETKKAETEKKNANKVKEMLKSEQSRADEQRKLVDAERKKAEELAHQLQKLKCEADDARSKLSSEGSKIKDVNKKKLEAEKKKTIKEKKKAEEQQKIAEMSTKHALEEKQRAEHLHQQLEEYQKKYVNLQKDMEELKTKSHVQIKQKTSQPRNGADLDIEKEAELKKTADMYKTQAITEKARADKLAQQLENTKKRTKSTSKEIQDLVSSQSLTDPMKSAEMKLLKKRLKLEKERVKHANQVAEHEKKCKKAVEAELNQLKLEFARFSNRVGLCNCLAICNNENVNKKRKFSHPESGKELVKLTCAATKSSEFFKPSLDSPTPSLPISGTCTESTSGTAFQMEPLLGGSNRKKLDCSALVSSITSFSDRQLVGSQGTCRFDNTKEHFNLRLPNNVDNNVKSPLKVQNKEGKTRKKKRLNAIESTEQNETCHAKIAKDGPALNGVLGQSDTPLKEGVSIDQNEDGVEATTHTCNNDLEIFKRMFDGDCMKLLNLDSEIEEEKYRAAIEKPVSPTLPNIEFEINQSDDHNMSPVKIYDDSPEILRNCESEKTNTTLVASACIRREQDSIVETGPSDSGQEGIEIPCANESDDSCEYIVVFSEFRDSSSLSKICHTTRTFTSQCCAFSQSDYVLKNVVSALSADEIFSPKEKVCAFFSLFLKSFSSIALTNFNHVYDVNFLKNLDTFSGQLKKAMSDVEARNMFTKVVDLDELITLIQKFIIDEKVLFCNDINSDTLSLHDSKASFHQLVLGAVLLATVCAAFDRIDSVCEASYAISGITSSSTLTFLHVFAYICGEKLLNHDDYSLIMAVIKSFVTHCERHNMSADFPPCAKCPFSVGAVSMEELASLLLKRFSDCCMHTYGMTMYKSTTVPDDNLSNMSDVLSLLELLASKMSWGWVCENIINQLLKLLEVCVAEAPLTAVFVLLGQMTRLGIDANGFQDTEVENIRVKLSSFISQSTSNKISLPVQLAAINALVTTTPLTFQEICKNTLEQQPVVSPSTATDSIQNWFSLLTDEQKSLSVRLLTANVS